MRVVSIDPHPSKDSVVCTDDGNGNIRFLSKTTGDLREFVKCLAKTGVLLCWDAPLTGPRSIKAAGQSAGDFSIRGIERFFRTGDEFNAYAKRETGTGNDKKSERKWKGISVSPYAQCQHWTITRSMLGLPRVGEYDQNDIPFRLLVEPDQDPLGQRQPRVAEVHPAVAVWLWCKNEISDFRYKDRKAGKKRRDKIRKDIWAKVARVAATHGVRFSRPPGDSDELDAGVGFLLGALYLQDRHQASDGFVVQMIGSRNTGAWLLPAVQGLAEAWESRSKRAREKPTRSGC